jgi:hypothetical protein
MPAWRTLTVQSIRMARWVRPTVIVPMTFSNIGYLNEVRAGISAFDADVRHFCLIAPVEVVHERLRARGTEPTGAWVRHRVAECCQAHGRPEFSEHISTAGRSVAEVVRDVLARVGINDPGP